MAAKPAMDELQRVICLALDAKFYRTVYEDVGAHGDVLGHYVHEGWRERRDPAPWFSTRRYLEANPDVAKAGHEPLHHYLTKGRREGRDAFPSEHATRYFSRAAARGLPDPWGLDGLIRHPAAALSPAPQIATAALGDDERSLVAREFDAAYYVGMNPDVAEAGTDPLSHFLVAGWREGRDPNPQFSIRDYLEAHDDVARAGVNPFLHYLMAGRAEGRKARHDLGFRYDILAGLRPVGARIARAEAATAEVRPGSAEALAAALARSRCGGRDLHVTFSHDDYTANLGGVQLCLQREAARVAALGRDHLHLFPAAPWPVVREAEPGVLGVLWNGERVGGFDARTIAAALNPPSGAASFAIHSLLGHSVDETLAILAATGMRRGFFWLHDFASLCAGFHLLRNDVEDCAAPPPDSAACGVCVYGPWRARHVAEHGRLFEALELTVVSPSQPTLDLWRAAWRFPATRELVLPHARLVKDGPAPVEADGPLRVGFPGLPAAHKGWPVFKALAQRFADDPRYSFTHLGGRQIGGLPMAFAPVAVTAERPDAMRQALADARIDVALVWPLCRETFSFTAYEAVAAGAAVVTNPDSGNVAAFVADGGHGQVVPDEAALVAMFESGEVLALARDRRRPALYDLAFSGMTVDLLHAEQPA